MGRKERKPRESAPYVPDFGTQGTGAAHGGHRSRRGRGPRMAWPPSAVLEGGAHKRSAVGRIAPKGRTSRGPLPAGDSPTCSAAPPGPAGERNGPKSFFGGDSETCGRTEWAEIVLQRERAPRGTKKPPRSPERSVDSSAEGRGGRRQVPRRGCGASPRVAMPSDVRGHHHDGRHGVRHGHHHGHLHDDRRREQRWKRNRHSD